MHNTNLIKKNYVAWKKLFVNRGKNGEIVHVGNMQI